MRPRRLPRFAPPTVADAQPTAAQEAKAEVYKELGYRQAGMVGVNLAVARPMVKAQGLSSSSSGHGKTTKTLTRYKR
jgi:hypothetical protein